MPHCTAARTLGNTRIGLWLAAQTLQLLFSVAISAQGKTRIGLWLAAQTLQLLFRNAFLVGQRSTAAILAFVRMALDPHAAPDSPRTAMLVRAIQSLAEDTLECSAQVHLRIDKLSVRVQNLWGHYVHTGASHSSA